MSKTKVRSVPSHHELDYFELSVSSKPIHSIPPEDLDMSVKTSNQKKLTLSQDDTKNEQVVPSIPTQPKKTVRKTPKSHKTQKSPKKYVCDVCGHICNTNGAYVSHLRKHDPNSKKHECLECGKKFRTASEVRRHQSTHSGVKNYQCPIESCGRSFTTNSYLQIHLKSHKTAESFQCTKKGCSMKFFLKTDLIEHVKTCHKDVTSGWGKPAFCCPYDGCPMAFEYPSFLYKHCAAQHQKSEYMCGFDNCYCSFDRFELFLDHLKVVHKMSEEDYKEETVECELCGVPVLKRALQQHMRKAHSTKFVKADEDGNLVVDKDKQWFKV